MNAVTVQVIREGLGHTRESFARQLNVKERTVREWELGQRDIPEWLEVLLKNSLDSFVDQVESTADDPRIVVPRGDRNARAQAWACLQINPELNLEEA